MERRPASKKQKTRRGAEITPENAAQVLSAAEHELTRYDKQSAPVSTSCEMGVIEEIYCENFMCHRKLRVTLSPHINFITGENGSGKSAIIAAIQICFGATARTTHRGKNIKAFIGHEFDGNALVSVKLRNDNSDVFHPDKYGKNIIVERLIRRDGWAEYRLKNEQGHVVSKLKSELDTMMDRLNIQTDNPCAVMDQENAKLFLKGTSEDKYKFFLQSTDLAKMRTTYTHIDETTRMIIESALKSEVAKIATLRDAKNKTKKQWQESQSIGKLEKELELLKTELEWSFVDEKETITANVQKKLKQKECDATSASEKLSKATNEAQQLEQDQNDANAKLEEASMRMDKNHRQKMRVKSKIREARRPIQQYKAELSQVTRSKERTKQQLTRLHHDLQQKRDRHAAKLHRLNEGNKDLRDRVGKKQQEVAQTESDLHDTEADADAHRHTLRDLEDRQDDCKTQLRQLYQEAETTKKRLNSLKQQKQNRVAAFGRNIAHLQQLIQTNLHQFTAPPIGPLGMYITLPDDFMRFERAIEVATGSVLRTFLVVNGQDKALLDKLRRQAHCSSTEANMIISARTGYRYNNLELPSGDLAAHAICNILQVNNDEVFNALVDTCSLESKLLFDDREVAERRVLTGSSGSFRMARFVSEVYLPSGDKFVVRSGNLAYIANKRQLYGYIVRQNVDRGIVQMKNKLDCLEKEVDELRRDESLLSHDKNELGNDIKQQSDRVNFLSRRLNQQRMELRCLNDEIDDILQDHTLDTSVLESE
ncbi:hypothetical protein F441_13557 [Phytophthora nicotianae CJ01A1]|uniref:Rad50/SbcC-type AAA domain-containing protein n=1 Tax=Phytophthora nicotianae CJ01A1 TaxID=1317063 RepID=W2WKK4_PHYNI|nr:hypothetical protein F441_13557 [Phytophthora nicotianae CJ01A1]